MGIWVNSVKGFCQNIHHVILICRWHLPASCNRNFFARIFSACPILLGTTMQSLKSWCFHDASSDVFRGVGNIRLVLPSNMSSVSIFPSPRFLPPPTTQHRYLPGPFTLFFNSMVDGKSEGGKQMLNNNNSNSNSTTTSATNSATNSQQR